MIIRSGLGYLNSPSERRLGRKSDKTDIELARGRHTLLFIPCEYWSIIFVAFGVYEVFIK